MSQTGGQLCSDTSINEVSEWVFSALTILTLAKIFIKLFSETSTVSLRFVSSTSAWIISDPCFDLPLPRNTQKLNHNLLSGGSTRLWPESQIFWRYDESICKKTKATLIRDLGIEQQWQLQGERQKHAVALNADCDCRIDHTLFHEQQEKEHNLLTQQL